MNAEVFNEWRAGYAEKTCAEHSALYDAAYKRDPAHASFAGRGVRVFLNQAGGCPVVAELGGRNGALAKVALDSTPSVKRWINYEICGAAIVGSVTQDPRYEPRLMTDFGWWKQEPVEGDILIASHVIEHLSDEDFQSFVASLPANIRGVHVQSPLPMRGPMNWRGFAGAHILSFGWLEVDREFAAHGFRTVPAYDGASWMRP